MKRRDEEGRTAFELETTSLILMRSAHRRVDPVSSHRYGVAPLNQSQWTAAQHRVRTPHKALTHSDACRVPIEIRRFSQGLDRSVIEKGAFGRALAHRLRAREDRTLPLGQPQPNADDPRSAQRDACCAGSAWRTANLRLARCGDPPPSAPRVPVACDLHAHC